MAIARLDGFSGDIEKLKAGLDSGELHTIRTKVVSEIERQKRIFTEELLNRLQSGKVGIQAGGYGLEKLIKELLRIEGYEATIQAKNQTSGIADIDIKATKQNNVTGKEEILLIQVKHHHGTTGTTGVEQLIASTETEDKILITTANSLDTAAIKLAVDNSIIVRDGGKLVDWIYENIEQLSNETREQLGVAIIPVLIPL
jgi:restriction system protein